MSSKRTHALKFKINHSEKYQEFFATGAFGGMNPNKCTVTFFDDKPMISMPDDGGPRLEIKEVNRVIQSSVILTPVQFKQIADWMMKNVQAYESRFGKIELRKVDEEKQIGFIS
jgi:hypothetical protein